MSFSQIKKNWLANQTASQVEQVEKHALMSHVITEYGSNASRKWKTHRDKQELSQTEHIWD